MSSTASSDPPPVDLEKGVVAEGKAAANEMNPRVVICKMILMDAVAVVEVLVFMYVVALSVRDGESWWDPLLAVVIGLPILLLILWIKPKTNYAMARAKLAALDSSDLATKLVAEE